MNVEDLGHELCLGLGQVEAFLWELVAVVFIVIAQLAKGKVHLLECILRGIFHDCLLDLFKLAKQLHEHLRGKLLACSLILQLQVFALLLYDLPELSDYFLR